MATPEELDVEAAVLEHEAVKLEEQNRPVAAQVKLQQAKSKRDQAALRRQQAGARQSERVRDEDSQPLPVTRSYKCDAELSQFWKELPSCGVAEGSRVMVLPAVPPRSGLPRLKSMYVRESYERLTDMATDGSGKDILVTGSPGTGKSTWQLHLLHRLASTGQTVVVDWANVSVRLLFCPEGAFRGNKSSFVDELRVSSNYYLVDAQLPKAAAARRIETCSPKHSKLWAFVKEGAREMIMPPWSLDELEAALPLFPEVSLERLRNLYSLWGGSVRWTLALANEEDNEIRLERAISRSDLNALQLAQGRSEAADEVSSQLVHLIPNVDLRLSHLAMATPYVSDRVCERLLDKNQLDLRNFLVASTGEIDFAVLRGNLFESYAHLMYQRGGTFKVRYIDTGKEEDVELKPCSLVHRFTDLNEVKEQPDNSHCRPRAWPSVDFLRQPNDIVQVTQNRGHAALEAARIRDCFKVLRAVKRQNAEPVYLTLVVPPEVYPHVKEIPLKGKLGAQKFPVIKRIMRMPLNQARALALRPLLF